jgi:16S rRNA (adenine(1408)-N(1))-methyltransferase
MPAFIVQGKTASPLAASALEPLVDGYAQVLLDVGTGDGKHAYRYAKAHPDTFVLGMDASAENLREQSHRASRKLSRGGVPNVAYLRATLEELPGCLPRPVGLFHILLPWGLLLQQVIRPDEEFLRTLVSLAAPGAGLRIVLNTSALNAVPEIETIFPALTPDEVRARLEQPYARAGITIVEASMMHAAEATDIHTTWARRMTGSPMPDLLEIEARIG